MRIPFARILKECSSEQINDGLLGKYILITPIHIKSPQRILQIVQNKITIYAKMSTRVK